MSITKANEFYSMLCRDFGVQELFFHSSDRASYLEGFGVESDESQYLLSITRESFQRFNKQMYGERFEKRFGEFKSFFNSFMKYNDVHKMFTLFCLSHSEGSMTRSLELNRFLFFGIQYVVENKLPNYLLELIKFDYLVAKCSESPYREEYDNCYDGNINCDSLISLIEPSFFFTSNYDILSYFKDISDPPLRKNIFYLIAKDLDEIKSAKVYEIDYDWKIFETKKEITLYDLYFKFSSDSFMKNSKLIQVLLKDKVLKIREL